MSGGGANMTGIKATDPNAYGTASAYTPGGTGANIPSGQLANQLTGYPTSTPMVSQPQPASANDTITGYYQNILQRAPDQAGLDFWNKAAASGQSLDSIKQSFLTSQEFKGSPADQAGYNAYLDEMNRQAQQPQYPVMTMMPGINTYQQTIQEGGVGGVGDQPAAFINPTAITQSGGEGSGGAVNFQYRRGGIASLLR